MTVYANNDFYTREYLNGKQAVISPAVFPFYARKASGYIDQFTFGNVDPDNVPDVVKMCCCEIAESLFVFENSPTFNGISSEKVGDISRTYESGESAPRNLANTVKSVAYSWLANTGLMYRGGAYA